MTGLPENIEQLLTELVEKSRHEMNIMLALADAIRRTDEQLLREVRNVTLHHEMRREEIKGELQTLATRLCSLPGRQLPDTTNGSLHRQHNAISDRNHHNGPPPLSRKNWPHPADEIDAELHETFGTPMPRH